MRDIRIAAQIKKTLDSQGKEILKVTIPMSIMFESDFNAEWLESESKKLEAQYINLVKNLKNISKQIKLTHSNDRVLLYWQFGDKTLSYLEQNKKDILFIDNILKHLIRDVGVSDKIFARCKKFRLLYPDITKIDTKKSFDSYVSTFEGGYISSKRK